MRQKLVYFDNSAINNLHNDNPELLERLTSSAHFRPLVSEVNLIETGSIKDAADRGRRLRTLARLLGEYIPLPGAFPLLRAHLEAYQADGVFDDRELRERGARLWEALQEPTESWPDEAQATVDQHRRAQKEWYGPAMDESRKDFQERFQYLPEVEKSKHLKTAAGLLKYCWADPERMRIFVGDMLEERSEKAAEDSQAFLLKVPAWRAFLVGYGCAFHRRVFRARRYSKKRAPGSIDLSQFVYLPYCDLFVTDDRAQRAVGRMVCTLLENRPRVVSYKVFREMLPAG